jgi:hypothetical protein
VKPKKIILNYTALLGFTKMPLIEIGLMQNLYDQLPNNFHAKLLSARIYEGEIL